MTTRLLLAIALAVLAAGCAGTGASSAADVAADPGTDPRPPDSAEPVPEVAETNPDAIDVAPDTAESAPDAAEPSPEPVLDTIEPSDTAEADDLSPDTEPDATPDDWHLQYGTPCPLASRVGLFEVGVDTYGLAAVTGSVADRVNPLLVLEAKESEGPCVLLERPNPFCETPCPNDQQCAGENQCVPFPVPQDLGTVTIAGLVVPVSLEPDGQKNYTKADFEGTPFTPGANLELTAEGGGLAGFSLQGEGVALLELPAKTWPFHAGDPTTIQWTPGTGVGTIRLNLNVDQHGVTPVTLVCDVPDTGSYTVPGTLTALLSSYGVSGAPSSSIVRRTVDSVQLAPGCVELVVSHRVKTLLKVM